MRNVAVALAKKLAGPFKKPEVLVLLAALLVAQKACLRLFALLGMAWVFGGMGTAPSLLQRFRRGATLYVEGTVSLFQVSSQAVWWWYGCSLAWGVSALVIAWFLWQRWPWAYVGLFLLFGADVLSYIVLAVTVVPHTDRFLPAVDPTIYYFKLAFGFVAFWGFLLLLVTRKSVTTLFFRVRER